MDLEKQFGSLVCLCPRFSPAIQVYLFGVIIWWQSYPGMLLLASSVPWCCPTLGQPSVSKKLLLEG